MSGILRFAIQRSVTRLRISSLKLRDGVCINRSPACLNYLHNNHFQTSAHFSSAESINKFIKKIDQDARRTGRISLREVENVIEEIKSLRTASSTQSLMVIRCCGSLISEESPEKRTQLAQETWRTFAQLGIPMDISHYNALLRVYIENEHPFKPTDILDELEEKGIEPNRVTYQRLITRYWKINDKEGATRILKIMREKKMPINEVVFNDLILGHSQVNDMKNANAEREMYSILTNDYIEQRDIEKLECLFSKMDTSKHHDLTITSENMKLLINSFYKIRENQEILQLMQECTEALKKEGANALSSITNEERRIYKKLRRRRNAIAHPKTLKKNQIEN